MTFFCGWALITMCFAQQNVENVIGHKQCKICHVQEYAKWQQTLHKKTYKDLKTNPLTKKIMKRLRLEGNPRQQKSCQKCHYTLKPRGSRVRTIGAITCERCHGGAKNWVELHYDARIPKPKRRKQSSKAGMFHPGDIYGIADNCYSCHIISDEKLVDVGRHPVADGTFKLASHTQGKMRHNFVSGKGRNIAASAQRKRLFYVVGQSLELQYLLRALAQTKTKRNFFLLTQKQLKSSVQEMLAIHKIINKKETAHILNTLKKVKAVPNNRAELEQAATSIEKATKLLVKNYNVESWSSLDNLIPSAK